MTIIERSRRKLLRFFSERRKGVFHIGRRGVLRMEDFEEGTRIEKQFDNTSDGRACFDNELLAQRLFGEFEWLIPAVEVRPRTLAMPRFQEEQRLDLAVNCMSEAARLDAARQAVSIAWDIFNMGYAHRDFHAKNLFWVDGRLMAVDFETLFKYPEANLPAFADSYDISGKGLPSPYNTNSMGYAADRLFTLEKVLEVPFHVALQGVQERLKAELREASLDFKTRAKRHNCRAQRVYSAFSVPHLTIPKDEGQRDIVRRLERFAVTKQTIAGCSVLDLGCNVGGMLFELHKFQPAHSFGIEFDAEKVAIARKIARYAGFNDLSISQADIDTLKPEDIQGRHDVVFCLAINKHVKDPERLFWLLGQTTAKHLYFEGNSGTDVGEVVRKLTVQGFSSIEQLGFSDDDCVPENNVRPILTAHR